MYLYHTELVFWHIDNWDFSHLWGWVGGSGPSLYDRIPPVLDIYFTKAINIHIYIILKKAELREGFKKKKKN